MTNNKIIDFPVKMQQIDKPPQHRMYRGDGRMSKTKETKKDLTPCVSITLLNYDSQNQEEYSKLFLTPLIDGLLKRTALAKAE